jgi:hypothetical protein
MNSYHASPGANLLRHTNQTEASPLEHCILTCALGDVNLCENIAVEF